MAVDRALSPADAAVAVRSFPRRFRALLARPADEDDRFDPDEVGRRPGTEGATVVDHVVAAERLLTVLDETLAQVPGGEVALPGAFADLAAARWDDPGSPVPALLDRLEATAGRTAQRMETVSNDAWATPARPPGAAGTSHVLAATQEVVGAVAGHLRAAARVLEEVRT